MSDNEIRAAIDFLQRVLNSGLQLTPEQVELLTNLIQVLKVQLDRQQQSDWFAKSLRDEMDKMKKR
ncbi:MAG: hypothetical protein NTW87_14800 [Planctomycetota bacterium]|nr:hypothetical protein [Planctomycetota bacterium]